MTFGPLTLAILFCFSEAAHARTITIQKKIDPGVLILRLKEGGFSESVLQCPPGRMRCVLHLGDYDMRNPQPIIDAYVFVDAEAQRAKERDEIRALVDKMRGLTLTQPERDRVLEWVAYQLLAK